MAIEQMPDFTAIDRQCAEESRISKAKINRNRTWYRMMTRSAGKAFDAISAELKKESDTTLMIAFENLDNIERLNSWWFLENIKDHIGSVIYNELSDRGYQNVYRNHQPTKQWEKRRTRP